MKLIIVCSYEKVLAESLGTYYIETSARSGDNVDLLFSTAVCMKLKQVRLSHHLGLRAHLTFLEQFKDE